MNGTHSHIGDCFPITVYRLSLASVGVNVRFWNAGNGDSAPHQNVDEIWVGATDPDTGFPTHPNQPTSQVVEPDWTISTNNIGGTSYPSDGSDQLEVWGWIDTTGLGPVLLRDNNQNNGERGEVWIGLCGGTPTRQPGYQVDTNNSTEQTLLDPVQVPEGIHFVYGRISDLSVYAGIALEYTTDLSGAGGWVTMPIPRSYQERPFVECTEVDSCEGIPLGWDTCPPEMCSAVNPPIIVPESGPAPSTQIPVADNEVDTAIRTGLVGTSSDYALADHNHPIRRQAVVSPVLTLGGTGGTLSQSIILDRWSDEETVGVEWRALVVQTAGIGWTYLNVPSLAGFQQPKITVGTYRNQSVTPQLDDGDGAGGAAPQGPFMGAEAHHWSSTRRVYLGYYRRDVGFQTYVGIRAEWTRL